MFLRIDVVGYRFLNLGLEVHITEMDVNASPSPHRPIDPYLLTLLLVDVRLHAKRNGDLADPSRRLQLRSQHMFVVC